MKRAAGTRPAFPWKGAHCGQASPRGAGAPGSCLACPTAPHTHPEGCKYSVPRSRSDTLANRRKKALTIPRCGMRLLVRKCENVCFPPITVFNESRRRGTLTLSVDAGILDTLHGVQFEVVTSFIYSALPSGFITAGPFLHPIPHLPTTADRIIKSAICRDGFQRQHLAALSLSICPKICSKTEFLSNLWLFLPWYRWLIDPFNLCTCGFAEASTALVCAAHLCTLFLRWACAASYLNWLIF